MGEKRRRAAAGKLYPKETVLPWSSCLNPNCGIRMDMATNYADKRPKEGVIAICIKCAHIMTYDAQLKLRDLTDEEVVKVAGDKSMVFMVNALGQAKAEWEKKHGKGTWVNRQKIVEKAIKTEPV